MAASMNIVVFFCSLCMGLSYQHRQSVHFIHLPPHAGKCLDLAGIYQIKTSSATACAEICLSAYSCVSFNVQRFSGEPNSLCTLFDVTSYGNAGSMQLRPNCTYYESTSVIRPTTVHPTTAQPAVTTTVEQTTSPVLVTTPATCPAPYLYFAGSCYRIPISGGLGIKKTWYQARTYCQGEGGDLAIVDSAEKNLFLRNYHLNHYAAMPAPIGNSDYKGLWIALTQEGTPGSWQWKRNGEPDRLVSSGYDCFDPYWGTLSGYDCAGIFPHSNYTWAVTHCTVTLWFVCEKQP